MSTSPPQLPRLVREYIAAEKESARVWLRAEIDRFVGPLVDSVFDRLTNKLMAMNMDWDRILPGDGARVDLVKREIKEEIKEENEITLQNVMDSAPEANEQIGDCVKQEIMEEEVDGQMTHIKKEEEKEETNEVDLDYDNEGGDEDEINANNATDIDTWFDRWMRDEVELGDLEPTRSNHGLIPISNQIDNAHVSLGNASTVSNEPQSNLANLVDQEEGQVKNSIQHQIDETNEQAQMIEQEDGQSQAYMSKSARHDKRKLKVPQAHNELTNRDNQHVQDDEEDAGEGTSRKRPRPSPLTTSSTEQKQFIRGKSNATDVSFAIDTRATIEHYDHGQHNSDDDGSKTDNATVCTTNPTQPNLAQPNGHLRCPHCFKSWVSISALQTHLRVHTDERPFQCDLCDKRFKQKDKLTRHQLIHQNVKNFRCHQCEKQFSQKTHLDCHLLTHSGVRPFECRHCAQSFTTPDNRTRHEQAIHLHVKPYRCKQCGYSATQQSSVIIHIRVHHFGLPPTIKQQQALNIIDDRDPRELIEKVIL